MEPFSSAFPPAQPPASTPWILVVDDEPAILRLIESVLQGQGWTVFAADTGEKALDALKSAAHRPSVVICDVLMPRIDGLELTRRLLAQAPDLKVVHISGHLTDLSWWPTDMREHRFLAKPFSNDDLVASVRSALAEDNLTR
jgi:DNA-binding NtrC family response regulator